MSNTTTIMQYSESIGTGNIERILQYRLLVSSGTQFDKAFLEAEYIEREPNDYLLAMIKKTDEQLKKGEISRKFSLGVVTQQAFVYK